MDPYLDPLSGVLRNLLGITDAGELARAEAALSASRLVDLERCRLPGRYDLDHLRAFHRHILGDVYEWAGGTTSVGLALSFGQALASPTSDATENRRRIPRSDGIGAGQGMFGRWL